MYIHTCIHNLNIYVPYTPLIHEYNICVFVCVWNVKILRNMYNWCTLYLWRNANKDNKFKTKLYAGEPEQKREIRKQKTKTNVSFGKQLPPRRIRNMLQGVCVIKMRAGRVYARHMHMYVTVCKCVCIYIRSTIYRQSRRGGTELEKAEASANTQTHTTAT